jgi:hypothetical protein
VRHEHILGFQQHLDKGVRTLSLFTATLGRTSSTIHSNRTFPTNRNNCRLGSRSFRVSSTKACSLWIHLQFGNLDHESLAPFSHKSWYWTAGSTCCSCGACSPAAAPAAGVAKVFQVACFVLWIQKVVMQTRPWWELRSWLVAYSNWGRVGHGGLFTACVRYGCGGRIVCHQKECLWCKHIGRPPYVIWNAKWPTERQNNDQGGRPALCNTGRPCRQLPPNSKRFQRGIRLVFGKQT